MCLHSSADHTPPIESMYVLRNRLPCQQFPSRLRRGLVQSASEPPGLLCVPHVPVPACPLATFGRVEVQRSNGTA